MHIELLGPAGVRIDGMALDSRRWRLRKARLLVPILALAPGQRLHRDQVVEALWPGLDSESGSHSLHQALHVARRALDGYEAAGFLSLKQERVHLLQDAVATVDVVEFEGAAAKALARGDEPLLRAAVDLYPGDLTADLMYEEGLAERRDALRTAYRNVLVRLGDVVYDSGAWDQAQRCFEEVLDTDPLHEAAVRGVMRVLSSQGRTSAALARYERLREGLVVAYGTDPDEQTRELFQQQLTGGAVRSTAHRRQTLPDPLTSFVGREGDLAEVQGLIARHRLVTLMGAGGSGKTRLAIEVARSSSDSFADGARFVDLSGLAESRLLPDVVAAALDLTPGSGESPTKALTQQLRELAGLLVLDNCEHLLAASALLVTALVAACPELRVLVTSRERLRVSGEVTFKVPSLDVPPPSLNEHLDIVELGRVPSVQLFVDRAAQVRTDFSFDHRNAGAVAELCRRLDGMPLALELAAARVPVLEPAEILERLGDALSMLGPGPFGAARHETLRAALAWSYDLLTPHEQVLLCRLSVFAGGFDLAAAEAVCASDPLSRSEILWHLGQLVDKSLALAEHSGATTRYRLLETVRQYCAEHLVSSRLQEVVAARHCAYYLQTALAHDPESSQGVLLENPTQLDVEHDNFRAALRWSLRADPPSALALAASLWRFWFIRCHVVEGSEWVEKALEAAPAPVAARARALVGLTGLDARRGRSDRVREQSAEAVSIMARLGDPATTAIYRLVHATLVWATFDVEEAERIARGVESAATELGRADLLAASNWVLAHCSLTREDGVRAGTLLARCLDGLEASPDVGPPFLPVVTPCSILVPVNGRQVPSYEESLLVGRRVGKIQAVGYVLAAMGYAARLRGDLRAAQDVVARSLEHFTSLSDDLGRAQALNHGGCILRDSRQFDEAASYLLEAREIRHHLGDRRGEWMTKANHALLSALQGDAPRGRREAKECLSAFQAVEDRPSIANSLGTLANIELASGEVHAARDLYDGAVAGLATQSWPRVEAWHRLMAAELSVELGEDARARNELDRAADLLTRQRCEAAQNRLRELRVAMNRI